jgi:UDP-N-acetylglucosamine--N-acetylmuramyl-(pentapeptide) pyrophosphoryl-undecaprenol N-acetylglucosamine transferase
MPALAVAEALRRLQPDAELLYIGAHTGMEAQIVPRYGVPFQPVTARKLRKTLSLSTIGVAFSLYKGYREAKTYLRAFRADVVVGTGGYVAAAAVLAAAHLKIPTFLHEGNALAGRTNLWLARYAARIGVTFEESLSQFPAGKTFATGLPLRANILAPETLTPQDARCAFEGLLPDRFTVLVVGGSQGAQALNRIVLEAAPRLLDAGVQILHQVGTRNVAALEGQTTALTARGGYHAAGFWDERQMPMAFRAADLLVCRGGVSTLSEALVNGLPPLIVPLPTAYADHQTHNARALVKAGAGLLRPEAGLTADGLLHDILALRDEADRRERMAQACRLLARPDAAERVAKEALNLAGNGPPRK